MSFSERYGYKPAREIIQIDSMDEPLRNGLWSLLKVYCWDQARYSSGMYGGYYISKDSNQELYGLCTKLWFDFFKNPLDDLDRDWKKVLKQLRQHFFGCEWHEAYDFIEFVANNFNKYGFKKSDSKGDRLLFSDNHDDTPESGTEK